MEAVEDAFAWNIQYDYAVGAARVHKSLSHLTCGVRLGSWRGLNWGFLHALDDSRRRSPKTKPRGIPMPVSRAQIGYLDVATIRVSML
jgi:hypothetical protein